MPASSTIYNDGALAYSSRTLSISNGQTYVSTNFNLSREGGKNEVRIDTNGVPNARYATRGTQIGTATLQLSSSSQALPTFADYFTETDLNGESTRFYILDIGTVETQAAEKQVNISFAQQINVATPTIT